MSMAARLERLNVSMAARLERAMCVFHRQILSSKIILRKKCLLFVAGAFYDADCRPTGIF